MSMFTLTQRHLVVKILIYISLVLIILTPELIRHLCQLKTFVFLHRCLICAVLLKFDFSNQAGGRQPQVGQDRSSGWRGPTRRRGQADVVHHWQRRYLREKSGKLGCFTDEKQLLALLKQGQRLVALQFPPKRLLNFQFEYV